MKPKFSKQRARRKEGKTNLLFIVAGIVVLALLATLYIWQRMETVRLVKEIGKLDNKLKEIEKTRDYLTTEVTRLSSPQVIQPKAEKLLGLTVTDHSRQFALADPVGNVTVTEKWQKLLADLKHYSQKAWELAEPQAIAREKHD